MKKNTNVLPGPVVNRDSANHDTANTNTPVGGGGRRRAESGKGKGRATAENNPETTNAVAAAPIPTSVVPVDSAYVKCQNPKVGISTTSASTLPTSLNRSSDADSSLTDISNLEILFASTTSTIYPGLAGESTKEDPSLQTAGQVDIEQVWDEGLASSVFSAPSAIEAPASALPSACTFVLPDLSKQTLFRLSGLL